MTLINVLCMTGGELFANVNLKHFTQGKGHHHLLAGLVGYAIVIYFLIKSLGGSSLLWTSAMWEGCITIFGALIAVFMLGEGFESPIQWFGIFLAVLSMVLVHAGPEIEKFASSFNKKSVLI